MNSFNRLILLAFTASVFLTTSVSARNCRDSILPFKFYGEKKYRTGKCEDIGSGGINKKYCKDFSVASHCPKTCQQCDLRCYDSYADVVLPNKGETMYCSDLYSLKPKKRERKCEKRTLKTTCRSACSYCSGEYVINFDEKDVYDFDDYWFHGRSGLSLSNMIAFNASLFETYYPEIPFEEVTVSKPNGGGNWDPSSYTGIDCYGGLFDLQSIHIAPLWDFENTTDPTVSFGGFDTNYDLVAEYSYTFQAQQDVKYISFPPEFKNLQSVYFICNDNVTLAFDDIAVDIVKGCYSFDEKENHKALEGGSVWDQYRFDKL